VQLGLSFLHYLPTRLTIVTPIDSTPTTRRYCIPSQTLSLCAPERKTLPPGRPLCANGTQKRGQWSRSGKLVTVVRHALMSGMLVPFSHKFSAEPLSMLVRMVDSSRSGHRITRLGYWMQIVSRFVYRNARSSLHSDVSLLCLACGVHTQSP